MAEPTNPIWIGADMTPFYAAPTDSVTGDPLTTGTCTWELRSEDKGTVLDSGDMPYDADSGQYLGELDRDVTLTLTEGEVYWLKQVFNQGEYDDERWHRLKAAYRGRR